MLRLSDVTNRPLCSIFGRLNAPIRVKPSIQSCHLSTLRTSTSSKAFPDLINCHQLMTPPRSLRFASTEPSRNDVDFQSRANRFLADLYDGLDALMMLPDIPIIDVDYDLGSGHLSVEIVSPEGRTSTILINRHYITRQLWYSTPTTGAHYFEADEKNTKEINRWIEVRSILELGNEVIDGETGLLDKFIFDIEALSGNWNIPQSVLDKWRENLG